MDWLNWIVNNWYVLVVIGIAIVMVYVAITDKARVKEWLRYAVTIAEQELGSGTGQIKLRQVYDMFIERFPREQLEKNQKIKELVNI